MKNDKTTKLLLTVIAVALVGNLLRPLLDSKPAQAQTGTPSLAPPAHIFEAKYDTPYVVTTDDTISVWYVRIKARTTTTDGGTSLVRADMKSLR